jgi:hypothetical protein
MEKPGGLPSKMQGLGFCSFTIQTARASREGNGFLDERPQLLRLWQSRYDSLFSRID